MDTANVEFRGKIIALNAYVRIEERCQINESNFHLKLPHKKMWEHQMQSKQRKENNKQKTEKC